MKAENRARFDELLRTGSPEKFLAFLKASTSAEHKVFRDHLQAFYIPRLGSAAIDLSGFSDDIPRNSLTQHYVPNCLRTILVCGSQRDLQAVSLDLWVYLDAKDTIAALQELPRNDLDEWVAHLVKQPGSRRYIEPLVCAELVDKPKHVNYLTDVLSWWITPNPYEQLPQIPGMLEENIWRFFEFEGDGHRSLATHEGYCVNAQRNEPETTFWWAFKKFSEEGRLSRDRLLTTSLEALARDFSGFRAGWFSRFHESLEPTAEERIARRHAYLRLLGSANPPTVSFALKALQHVDRADGLEPVLLAAHISPALHAKAKSAVLAALRLVATALQRESDVTLLTAACAGLSHESTQVQERILQLFQKHHKSFNPTVREKLMTYRNSLAPSTRGAFHELMGTKESAMNPATLKNDDLREAFLARMQKHGFVENLRTFLLALTPEQRAALRPLIKKHAVPMMDDGFINVRRDPVEKRTPSENQRGVLAALACGTVEDALAAKQTAFQYGDTEELIAFLRKVRPPWMQDWVEGLCEQGIDRHWIEPLVRADLVQAPRHENYLKGLLRHLAVENVYEELPKIPNMLEEDIWRFFEFEGDGESSLANREKYTENRFPEEASFKWALRRWSEEGRLSRGRLLNASLDALSRDFIQYRAGWFSRFHEYMAPTPEERALRVERYLALLGSGVDPTVSFALKSLKVIDKRGKIPPDKLVEVIGPALQAKSKGTVTAALRLIAAAAKRHPDRRGALLVGAASALLHESPEVHESVLALLQAHTGTLDEPVREALKPYLETVAPSIRTGLAKLLDAPAAEPAARAPKHKAKPQAATPPPDEKLAKRFEIALKTRGKPEAFVKFLLKLTPEERTSLGPLTRKLAVPRLRMRSSVIKGKLVEHVTQRDSLYALLAILACGTLADAKQMEKANFYIFQSEDLIPLLSEVSPPWLQDWVDWLTHNEHMSDRIVELYDAGLVTLPWTDTFLGGLCWWYQAHREGPYKFFSRLPGMPEPNVWRYFEIDKTECFNMGWFATDTHHRKEADTFGGMLRRWCGEGKLDRDRVLDACLAALGRDFQQIHAGGYVKLFNFLKPTPEECLARVDAFLALLNCGNASTVSFAIKELKAADRQGAVTPEALLDAVAPALQAKGKGVVNGALQLIANAAKRDADRRPQLLAQAAAALLHESPEVHERVLKLLGTYRDAIDSATAQALAPYLDAVAPSVRAKLAELLPADADVVIPVDVMSTPVEVPSTSAERVAFLSPERRVEPIADVDELLAQAAYVLETPDDIRAIERVFAGLLAWNNAPDKEGHPALAPLAKRARDLALRGLEREVSEAPLDVLAHSVLIWQWAAPEVDIYEELRQILAKGLTWRAREMAKTFRRSTKAKTARDQARLKFANVIGALPEFPPKTCKPSILYRGRLAEIYSLLREPAPPLLSTPTHEAFMIDPAELVARSLAWQETDHEPKPFDQLSALLRLAPEGHTEALQQAKALQGSWGELLRHALGGDPAAKQKPLTLWRAARSIRPDAPHVSMEWKYKQEEASRFLRGEPTDTYFYFHFEPRNEKDAALAIFRDRRNDEWLFWSLGIENVSSGHHGNAWILALWPSGFDTLAYAAAAVLGTHISDTETAGLEMIVYIEALADPAIPWGDGAYELAAMALQCSYPDLRAVAAQAVIARAECAQLDTTRLGGALCGFLNLGCFYPARLRKSLDDVALAGPSGSAAVVDILQRFLQARFNNPPRDIGKLLELLYEQLIDRGEILTDAAVLETLRHFPGKGRAGTLAKRLVKLAG